MYMFVKLLPRDLNVDLYLPHPTITYIYKMTIPPKVCTSTYYILNIKDNIQETYPKTSVRDAMWFFFFK